MKQFLFFTLLLSSFANIFCMDQVHLLNNLETAIRAGNIDQVRHILTSHPLVLSIPTGIPPLNEAVSHNQVAIVQLLLDCGANINSQDNLGNTALHWALYNKEMTQLLLDRGAHVNLSNHLGTTALHWAAERGILQAIQPLLTHHALIDARDNNGRTPLHISVLNNNRETAQFLIEHGAQINASDTNGQTPLHLACNNHLEIKNERNSKNRAELVKLLITHGADIKAQDNQGQTPLHTATLYQAPMCVQVLLEHGANVNAQNNLGQTPLFNTIINYKQNHHGRADFGYYKITELLLLYGANPNISEKKTNCTPLHYAAEKNRPHVATLLLHYGAKPYLLRLNYRNRKTPLDIAQSKKHPNMVQLLEDWPYYDQYRNRQMLAFCMAQHERLGENSPAHNLPEFLFKYIGTFVRTEWKSDTKSLEQMHKIANEQRAYEQLHEQLTNQRNLKRQLSNQNQQQDSPDNKKRKTNN